MGFSTSGIWQLSLSVVCYIFSSSVAPLSRPPEMVFVSESTLARHTAAEPSPLLSWLNRRTKSIYGDAVVKQAPDVDPADLHFLQREVCL